MEFGLLGLLVLAGDLFAIFKVLKSSAGDFKKILWIVVIALLPVAGLILWYLLGPGDKKLQL